MYDPNVGSKLEPFVETNLERNYEYVSEVKSFCQVLFLTA